MIRRELTISQIEKEPWIVWNSFVDLLAMEDYDDLTSTQRVASSLFWYDSEVQNGGHLQYFLNHGIEHVKTTLDALQSIGNKDFQDILKTVLNKYNSLDLTDIDDVEDYVEEALEDHFGEMDGKYYSVEPTIQSILEEYLEKNKNEFILIK